MSDSKDFPVGGPYVGMIHTWGYKKTKNGNDNVWVKVFGMNHEAGCSAFIHAYDTPAAKGMYLHFLKTLGLPECTTPQAFQYGAKPLLPLKGKQIAFSSIYEEYQGQGRLKAVLPRSAEATSTAPQPSQFLKAQKAKVEKREVERGNTDATPIGKIVSQVFPEAVESEGMPF